MSDLLHKEPVDQGAPLSGSDDRHHGPHHLRSARPDQVWAQHHRVVDHLSDAGLAVATDQLDGAAGEILTFTGFPKAHWRQIWSINPKERFYKRSDVAPTSSGSSPPGRRRMIRALTIFGVAALFASSWVAAIDATTVRGGELGFRSSSFVESSAVRVAVSAVPGSSVFSNVPDGLWVAGVDAATPTPAWRDPFSLRASDSLESELEELKRRVDNKLAVIFLSKSHVRLYLLDESELRTIAPCVVAEDADSVLLSAFDHPLCGR